MAAKTLLPVCSTRLGLNSRIASIKWRCPRQSFFADQPFHSHPSSCIASVRLISHDICRVGSKPGQQEMLPKQCVSSRLVPHSLSWCVVRSYGKKVKKEKGGKKKVVLTSEQLEGVLDLDRLQNDMHTVVEDLKKQMVQQVSIRTNIGVYDHLQVKTADGVFPLMQLGQIVQKNPSLILINLAAVPEHIPAVKDAIAQSGLNVNPQQDGTTLFIPVPKITREHRESLAKNAKMIHDKAKVQLRDIHNKYVKKVKAAKDHHSEDIVRGAQDTVLNEMHSYEKQLDVVLVAKQQELLGGK